MPQRKGETAWVRIAIGYSVTDNTAISLSYQLLRTSSGAGAKSKRPGD